MRVPYRPARVLLPLTLPGQADRLCFGLSVPVLIKNRCPRAWRPRRCGGSVRLSDNRDLDASRGRRPGGAFKVPRRSYHDTDLRLRVILILVDAHPQWQKAGRYLARTAHT
jgi:hypothetical protein